MLAKRFSRIAFARRLDRVRSDLERWEWIYKHDHEAAPHLDPRERLLERSYAIAEVIRHLDEASDMLLAIRRVS